jgi:hypothetical protein
VAALQPTEIGPPAFVAAANVHGHGQDSPWFESSIWAPLRQFTIWEQPDNSHDCALRHTAIALETSRLPIGEKLPPIIAEVRLGASRREGAEAIGGEMDILLLAVLGALRSAGDQDPGSRLTAVMKQCAMDPKDRKR